MKTAIITGAGSGIGRAIALQLAGEGWQLALTDIDDEKCRQTLAEVRQLGSDGLAVEMDVSRLEDWEALYERVRGQWEHLDLLVNNAGVGGSGEVAELSIEDWEWMLGINLHSVIYGCHTMLPWLKENPRGAHILNNASLAAFISAPAMPAYNVSKAGVVSYSETLQGELSVTNVRVTVLCIGFAQTGIMSKGRFKTKAQRRSAAAFIRKSRLSPEFVARRALAGVKKKKFYVVEGWRARMLWRFKRLMPRTLLWVARQGYARDVVNARGSQDPPSAALFDSWNQQDKQESQSA